MTPSPLAIQSSNSMSFCKTNSSTLSLRDLLRSTALGWCLLAMPIVLLLGGCSGSKSLSKRGMQLESAGMYTEAANFYFNALVRNSNNIDARVGLSNTSRKVLNDKLDNFSRHRAMEEHRSAFDAYRDAVQYRERIRRFGIAHEIPQHFVDDYEVSKNIVLRGMYERGSDLMAERKFADAKLVFAEILRIDPAYEDVGQLKGIAKNEPLYLEGTDHFDAGRYRAAYRSFEQIFRNDANYRDVAVLMQEALNLGRFPVAISPMVNATAVANMDQRVYAYFVTALTQINDPFLRIVERQNMETILSEQRLSLSGIVDQNTASQVGNLLGAKALITGTVLTYSSNAGRVRRTDKDGFESYQVQLTNAETQQKYFETRYKPVKYSEYYQQNEVRLTVQYKAISLESGEVLFSRILEGVEEDQMYYAAYDGEVSNLFAAGPNGTVLTSSRDRQRIQSLIRAPRTVRSVDELTNQALNNAASGLREDLQKFLSRE